MYIERTLAKKLKESAQTFPLVAVTGPRQSGKTVLVRHVFPAKKYVTLEDLDTREFARKDPRGFLSAHADGAIFDEVQRAPELFSYLQGVVDEARRPGQFILTGSQNFLLHEGITQSLAGRVAMLTLLPLSIEEVEGSTVRLPEYRDAMFQGFYPRVHDTKVPPHEWYAQYLLTYVERDVRQVKNIMDLGAFQLFLKMCAGRGGQLLNLSALAHDCGITHNTARAWLSVLEASYLVFLLRPHHRSFNKRLVKMPKLYFFDPGLACALLGIEQPSQLDTHPMKGALFESMMLAELMKQRLHRGAFPHLYFWRDQLGHEIDCVNEASARLIPIEIKAGKTIVEEYFRDLQYWNGLAQGSSKHSFLIYGGEDRQMRKHARVIGWKYASDIFSDSLE